MKAKPTISWPAVGSSVLFTAAVLAGYAYYVHQVEIPAAILAEQQRALAAVHSREVPPPVGGEEDAGTIVVNHLMLVPASPALRPATTADPSTEITEADASGGAPFEAAASVAELPEVTIYVTPPAPLAETKPATIPPDYYWEPGFWAYREGRFNWTTGNIRPVPAAYASSFSRFVPTKWVVRDGAYTLVPGYWINPPANASARAADPVNSYLRLYDTNHDGSLEPGELAKMALLDPAAYRIASAFADDHGQLGAKEMTAWRAFLQAGSRPIAGTD